MKKIAVAIPAYNHAPFIAGALESVFAQNWPELEVHILDDGSSDDTAAVAERTRAKAPVGLSVRIDRQDNRGSARTINRMIDRIDADYVAILNSDDLYAPGRLAAFAARAEGEDLFFGVSGVEFIESGQTEDFSLFSEWYRSKFDRAAQLPTFGFAFVLSNISVTSSNFFFSRALFDLADGFDPALTLTQDWDFALRAVRWTEPVLLPERLLLYRAHPGNTWRRLQGVRREQSEQVLRNFVARSAAPTLNRLAPSPINWPAYLPAFLRICRPVFGDEPLGAYFPPEWLAAPAGAVDPASPEGDALHRLFVAAQRGPSEEMPLDESLAAATDHWARIRAAPRR
ncbi:glycosyltransferase family 2 protein [Prosthecomicrobium pneumaticum]|uniref:Glycosyltransferase involved in cell wall biosynthesis n=1 Tax=Prosthecomicrobium pneumaticum TaxID=81895 RepID=A0A7W9FQX0_9HYPH|nr:glycosyltransferase [Prosthecomicrobium pneumaticum]MBB5755147.1 glycosyltransferase involved in cell wall biosynthesis [Prosthecomicrobium pneumaticum]